jgi:hypothetical protein
MPAGRPTKYTDEVIEQIRQAVEVYTAMHDIPIVAEFAYMHKVPRQKLYEFAEKNEEFNETIKELIDNYKSAMQHLTYIAETTKSNPMLFRLYDREKLAALLQFVKENTNAQNKK